MKSNIFIKPISRFKVFALSLIAILFFQPVFSSYQSDKQSANQLDNTIYVYTSRKASLLEPLFKDFTDLTGIEVKMYSSKAGVLIEKLRQEGKNTEADIFLTTDISNIVLAKEQNLLKPFQSNLINQRIPEYLRDSDNHWTALSVRSRIFVYNPKTIEPNQLMSYESISSPDFDGSICVRSSENSYNQGLLASIILNESEEKALDWATGVVSNMARKPQGNDRDQIRAVVSGLCDVAIVNTYYLGLMLDSSNQRDKEIANKVKIIFPEQNNQGSHANVSAIGLLKNSDNLEKAKQLIEFMTSNIAQKFYAKVNHEYPAREGVELSEIVASWGEPKLDKLSVEKLSQVRNKVIEIFNQANWQ